jgi:hypothetical protein
MTKELFALLMAGALRPNASQSAAGEFLPLPPVPHLDTMPWVNSAPASEGLKIDTLFGPKLDTFGPFLLEPVLPRAQISAGAAPSGVVKAE